MSSNIPFPISVAKWLKLNTSLSNDQIARFTSLPISEINVLSKIHLNLLPKNPIILGILTKDEIARCEGDPSALLLRVATHLTNNNENLSTTKLNKTTKEGYICFVFEAYPKALNAKIAKLFHSTEKFVSSLREDEKRIKSIKYRNPLAEGFCAQEDIESLMQE